MKKLIILFIVILIFASIGFIWWNNGNQPINTADKTPKAFIINKGQSIRDIGYSLKQAGIIRDPIVFFILVKQLGLGEKIQAGNFRLNASMTAMEITQTLTHGSIDFQITIPEGKRAAEIAKTLQAKVPTYTDTWKTNLTANEGYLFPDTYLIPNQAASDMVIRQMRANFDQKYAALAANQTGKTQTEIVTLASLIEREAKYAQDRPLVASVLYNRLSQGMPLQIDATIQYAIGYDEAAKTWWKNNLTVDDLAIVSPYNTYTHTGLPPTPICNPGVSALNAALHPQRTSYIYYVSDSSGHLHFAKTLDEHNVNIKKYGVQ